MALRCLALSYFPNGKIKGIKIYIDPLMNETKDQSSCFKSKL